MCDYALHQIFAEKMAQRLAFLKQSPAKILCVGADGGVSRAILKKTCPEAKIDCLETDAQKYQKEIAHFKSQQNLLQKIINKPIDIFRQPENIAKNNYDCLWANVQLPTEQQLQQWAQFSQENGVLFFNTNGNQTLKEYPDLFNKNLPDMHDIGDIIQRNHWTDTVVDSDIYTLTYENANALIKDIKTLALSDYIDEGKIISLFSGSLKKISLEIIFAHAVKHFRQPENEQVVQFYQKNPYRK